MKKRKIIVVDDDQGIRTSVRFTLDSFEVIEAGNGADGLKVFRENPDAVLVVSDVSMPGMSGPDLVTAIKSERPGLPVVLMSGQREEDVRHTADMFFRKPFDLDELRWTVKCLVG